MFQGGITLDMDRSGGMDDKVALDCNEFFHRRTERYQKYLFHSGDSVREDIVNHGVKWLYRYLGLGEPVVVIVDSPLSAQLKANELFDDGYLRYFDFVNGVDGDDFRNITINDVVSKLSTWKDKFVRAYRKFLMSGIFMAIYLDGYAIVCRRPRVSKVNSKGQFHNDHGAAVRWRDGFGLYFLNGVHVTKKVVMTPAGKLDPRLIFTTQGRDSRREIIKKIGHERIFLTLKGRVVDKWASGEGMEYELVALELPDTRNDLLALRMKNLSTGAVRVKGVPAGIDTCRKALLWRDGQRKHREPDRLA